MSSADISGVVGLAAYAGAGYVIYRNALTNTRWRNIQIGFLIGWLVPLGVRLVAMPFDRTEQSFGGWSLYGELAFGWIEALLFCFIVNEISIRVRKRRIQEIGDSAEAKSPLVSPPASWDPNMISSRLIGVLVCSISGYILVSVFINSLKDLGIGAFVPLIVIAPVWLLFMVGSTIASILGVVTALRMRKNKMVRIRCTFLFITSIGMLTFLGYQLVGYIASREI